jgi:hypothetical protein
VENVCWLLAYGEYHASGDRRDIYNFFSDLHQRGELAPTEDDYLALEEDLTSKFLTELRDTGQGLLDEARARPGRESMDSLYGDDGRVSIVIDVVVIDSEIRLEEGWLGITLPRGSRWPARDVYVIALALLGGSAELRPSEKVGSRDRRNSEIAFTWDTERSVS